MPMLRADVVIGAIGVRSRAPAPPLFTQQADRAGHHLRRPGGDRDRERAAVRRGAGAHEQQTPRRWSSRRRPRKCSASSPARPMSSPCPGRCWRTLRASAKPNLRTSSGSRTAPPGSQPRSATGRPHGARPHLPLNPTAVIASTGPTPSTLPISVPIEPTLTAIRRKLRRRTWRDPDIARRADAPGRGG